MKRRTPAAIWIGLLCAGVALAFWWFDVRSFQAVGADSGLRDERPQLRPQASPAASAPAESPSTPRGGADQDAAASEPSEVVAAAANCMPHASKACHEGDVFWFDSCGRAGERIEDCAGRPCLEIACAPAERFESHCGSVTAYGRCDGELAQACVAGRLVTVDCARSGQRCIAGREGVRCERPGPGFCTGREPARCEGRRLVQCNDGHLDVIDCARRNAECVASAGHARCEGPLASAEPRELELCNGRDDDADGKVDEDQVCDAVRLVPVIAEGASLTDFEARMQRDLEIVNRVFQPQRFQWAAASQAPAQWAKFPTRDLLRISGGLQSQIAADQAEAGEPSALGRGSPLGPGQLGGAHPPKFFIPVLFVERLDMEPPKGGISMLPNNRCGGVRVSDATGPPHGLIVLADERMPETLAHELGHFLGLCHTHEQVEHFAQYDPEAAACELTGDGICDTAFDPGPSACKADATCTVLCDDARAQPLGADIMSYYLGCRRALSADQLREAERNLALRRGWSRCADLTACLCTPGDLSACPADMSCRPVNTGGFACALDGASVPGAPCRDGGDCSGGSVCLTQGGAERGRCVRACVPNAAQCRCIDVGMPFHICSEDLGDAS